MGAIGYGKATASRSISKGFTRSSHQAGHIINGNTNATESVRWIRPKVLLTVLLLIALAAAPAPSADALIAPGGSCFDFRYYDGLDSRYSANHCRSALNSNGYTGRSYHNTSARQAALNQPLDSVFHFAGHAVTFDGGAIALLHESPGPNGDLDTLLGDPAAGALLTGPTTVCDETGRNCKSVLLTSYPWASELATHNLVVLQSCNTGRATTLFRGMDFVAWAAGTGTVISFNGLVSFPTTTTDAYGTKWARVFWENAGQNVSFTTATIRATNAVGGYGYQTYKITKNIAAPSSIRPAQYFVPGVGGVPTVTADAAMDERTASLARFLGGTGPVIESWEPVDGPDGSRFRGYAAGHGLYEVAADDYAVREAIFEPATDDTPAPGFISRDDARETATDVAAASVAGFGGLRLRIEETLDHEEFQEHRFVWQESVNDVWHPSKTSVGVNAATGEVLYVSSERHPSPGTSAERQLTEEDAVTTARSASGLDDRGELLRPPSLEVLASPDGTGFLTWVIELAAGETNKVQIPNYQVVHVDATTGEARIVARS